MQERGLTVRELIEQLSKEDQKAIVAIENNGYPYTTTKMSTVGWLGGDYLMHKDLRIAKEYFDISEIAVEAMPEFDRVLVIGTTIGKDEVKKCGIITKNGGK